MDVKDRECLSGLVLDNDPEEPASWTRNDQDLPLFERCGHASVVVHPPHNINEQIVGVLGGKKDEESATNSVFLLNAAQQSNCRKWIEGPAMNETRSFHAAVVCNGSVYAIGGRNDRHVYQNTIERIDIIDLLSLKKLNKENQWKTLTCRLSHERVTCSAAAIHNRYIVVVGGRGTALQATLRSVEIIDSHQNNQPTVCFGPPLNVPRQFFGMTVIGSCIYVGGGLSGDLEEEGLKSAEYLKLSASRRLEIRNNATSVSQPSLEWKIHEDLALSGTLL